MTGTLPALPWKKLCLPLIALSSTVAFGAASLGGAQGPAVGAGLGAALIGVLGNFALRRWRLPPAVLTVPLSLDQFLAESESRLTAAAVKQSWTRSPCSKILPPRR